ncbi:MAG: acyl carrier protein [Acidobacteria bacterium]|nr:MAG: acyl carrier protein [Acidobacteriota bacterium]
MSDVFVRFRQMVAAVRGIDEDRITPESRLVEDLEADSIDIVELMLDAEREFGINIEKQEAQSLRTVGEIVSFIEARLAEQSTSS